MLPVTPIPIVMRHVQRGIAFKKIQVQFSTNTIDVLHVI